MALTPSLDLPLGTLMPSFCLPDTAGNLVSLERCEPAGAYLVMFICNHCPYVKHLAAPLSALTREFAQREVQIFGIMSNDVTRYPADAPNLMKAEKETLGYVFPYLYDEQQNVAKAYMAQCTPEFFVFDRQKHLFYHGQFDDTRPGGGAAHGEDLRSALEATLEGKEAAIAQKPALGCGIKWR